MIASRFVCLFVIFTVSACGSGSGGSGGDDGTGTDTGGGTGATTAGGEEEGTATGGPVCPEEEPVPALRVTRVGLADVESAVCDADNNGAVDPDDLLLNELISDAGLLGSVEGSLQQALDDGEITVLTRFADAIVAGYVGKAMADQPDPECGIGDRIDEACHWIASPTSVDEACNPVAVLDRSSAERAGPTDFDFRFDSSGIALDLSVADGRLEAAVSEEGDVTGGQICGSIPKATLIDAATAACDLTPPTPFCAGFPESFLNALVTCDPCTVVVDFDAVAGHTIGMP